MPGSSPGMTTGFGSSRNKLIPASKPATTFTSPLLMRDRRAHRNFSGAAGGAVSGLSGTGPARRVQKGPPEGVSPLRDVASLHGGGGASAERLCCRRLRASRRAGGCPAARRVGRIGPVAAARGADAAPYITLRGALSVPRSLALTGGTCSLIARAGRIARPIPCAPPQGAKVAANLFSVGSSVRSSFSGVIEI
jgi:hypothetical protein